MYADIPFWLTIAFMLGGLGLLAWSANLFVDGAESVARSFGISPFVIGMVVIGFGTSAPELAVSAISGVMGHSNLSLGNAYGSNIVLSRDLPIMVFLSLSIGFFGINYRKPSADGRITRFEGAAWLLVFVGYATLVMMQELK